MRKILLCVACVLSVFCYAEDVVYVVSDYVTETVQKSPLTLVMDDITLTADKLNGITKPQYLASGYFCVYAKGQLTITAEEPMYRILFGGCDVNQLARLTPDSGEMTQEAQTNPIWTGEATSVTFTVSEKAEYGKSPTKAGQLRFMTLEITYGGSHPIVDPTDTILTQGVDLYYGHYTGTSTPNTYYNHQLWLTSSGLTFDGDGIIGSDGHVMRLDLFSDSSEDLCGTYVITDPNQSDHPGCINKKFSYYTYFVEGSFVEQKLTEGTCTITCTTPTTYTIDYNVREINHGAQHVGTLRDIPITAIRYDGSPYTLHPTCEETGIDEIMDSDDSAAPSYNALGQPVSADYPGIIIRAGKKFLQLNH